MNFKKLLAVSSLCFIFIATILLGLHKISFAKQVAQNISIDGLYLPVAQEMGDFHLTDINGKPFTLNNLKGHWTMLFFGFTNCGSVCPATMAALRNMYQDLQTQLSSNQLPQIVMVTVDPERDTVKRLKEYVHSFNPNFVGVRGDAKDLEALEKQLHVVSVKMQGSTKNQYTINHTAEVILFNPEGKIQAFLAYPHKATQMVQDYRLILKNYEL